MQAQTLVLPERSPLEKAAVLKAALLDYEDQLAVIEKQVRNEIEERTAGIRVAYNQTRTQYQRIVDQCVQAGNIEDSRYLIMDKSRKSRVVNPQRFKTAFPVEYDLIAQIPVSRAEALIGKMQLAPLCDVTQGTPVWELTIKKMGGR